MLASSSKIHKRNAFLDTLVLVFATWVLSIPVSLAASTENVTPRSIGTRPVTPALRTIGSLRSAIATRITRQIRVVGFSLTHDSALLLEGGTMSQLTDAQAQEIKATYRAGYTVMLLGATMQHIKALHTIVGEGVSYRSKDTPIVMAYALRRQNYTPTAVLLTRLDPSPLETASGDPDPTGILDEQTALTRAVARTVTELTHVPQPVAPGPLKDPNQQADWLSAPIQVTTFAINSPQGVYNTPVSVFALYRCIDQTDHYAVTAGADWTATNARWQGATSAGSNPSMYRDSNNNLVINWQDNNRTYCSSPGAFGGYDDVCRYINYPLSYGLTMVPRTESAVVQLNAAPAATQGQQTSYTSGFSFSIGGTVNVSAMGPAGGISLGATWSNTTQTTVPPLVVDVSNTGNEGVNWDFKYCTRGLEPDPGTNCTSHVQMVKDVCQAQLGDDSGTDPQQGQTPVGKFSNATQSAHWQSNASGRQGSTFDIEVAFQARTANTIAHLNLNGLVDPIQGCNAFNCACVSVTTAEPVTKSFTFQIPYPSTVCK
jgi:hypothetical protein